MKKTPKIIDKNTDNDYLPTEAVPGAPILVLQSLRRPVRRTRPVEQSDRSQGEHR